MTRYLSVALLLAVSSFAQTSPVAGFNLDRLSLNAGPRHSLVLDTGDVLDAQHLRVALAGGYQHDSLVLNADGVRVGALVGQRITTTLMAAYSLGRLEFALQLPLVAWQHGDDLSSRGLSPVTPTAFGSTVLQARYAFLRQGRDVPIDLGVTLGLGLPTGSAEALTRDPGLGLAFFPRVGGGRQFGFVRLGAELGVAVRGAATLSNAGATVVDEVGSHLTTGLVLSTVSTSLNAELSARAVVPFTQAPMNVELLAGGRYAFLDHQFEVFALAGPGIGRTPGTPLFRAIIGLSFTGNFSRPAEPAPSKNRESCVEGQPYPLLDCPMLDRDHDGVINGNDSCPNQAGTAAMNGCPAGNADP